MNKKLVFSLLAIANMIVFADNLKIYDANMKLDNLSINYNDSDGMEYLYVNNKLISTPKVPRKLSIVGKANIGTNKVYIIYGYQDGTVDQDTNMHYFYVTLDKNNNVKVSKLTHEAYKNKIQIESGLLNVTYHNSAPYSYESDLGVYTYDPESNVIKTLKNVRWDGYYQKQFESYTPLHVVDIIKKDGCYNLSSDDQTTFDFAHSCGRYGDKYCFMFKSIKNPVHDQSYQLLNNSCKQDINSYK